MPVINLLKKLVFKGDGAKAIRDVLNNTVGLLGSLIFLLFGMLSVGETSLTIQVANYEPHIIAFPLIVGILFLVIGITGMINSFWDVPFKHIFARLRERKAQENEYLTKAKSC